MVRDNSKVGNMIKELAVLSQSLPIYVEVLANNPNARLSGVGMMVDHSYSLEPGTSLAGLRALAALTRLSHEKVA